MLNRATGAALQAARRAVPRPARHGAALFNTNNTYNIAPCAGRVAAVHHSSRRGQPINKDKNEPAHAGSFARTDDTITVEYPKENELPLSEPVSGAGRAGMHVYPTLATFSLEGKVGVVTGGARGLGLVMGQGMVVSGADLAIVDMNSTFCLDWFGPSADSSDVLQRRRLRYRPRLSWTSSRRTIPTQRSKLFFSPAI